MKFKGTVTAALLATALAHARTIHVPDDFVTIQSAIDAAANGDSVLVQPGTYSEAITFAGKAIEVTSVDPSDPAVVAATVVDASSADCEELCSVVRFQDGEGSGSVLAGFTLTGGTGVLVSKFDYGPSTAGGGIYCVRSTPSILSCVVSGNSVVGKGGWHSTGGGGIYCRQASPSLIDCTVSDNTSEDFGGGVRCAYDCSPILQDCTIADNTSADNGGGVSCHDGCETTLERCRILRNSAHEGGGIIDYYNSSSILVDCTVAGNSAGHRGGGIASFSYASLTNCTVAANSSEKGGGLYCYYSPSLSVNTIFWANAPDQISYYIDHTEVYYSNVLGGWPGVGNIDADPRFCDATCGGFADLGLAADSPCLGTGFGGTDMGAWAQSCDLPRQTTGAVLEVPAAYSSIGAALEAACDHDTILIAPGVYLEPTLVVPALDVVVRGWDPVDRETVAATVIDGGGSDVLAFAPTHPAVQPKLAGVTITGGGCGLICNAASPWIDRCLVSGNAAVESGGGLRCGYGAAPLITNCIVAGNSTQDDGGGLNAETTASPVLRNCVIEGNSARRDGGGLHAKNNARPDLANCTLTGNVAEEGGAVLSYFAATSFTNCILWGNVPDEIVADHGRAPEVRYSDVQGGWSGDGNIDADPDWISYAGFDHLPAPGSPCIDAGDPGIQDGVSDWHPRWPDSYPNGPRSDMGAYGGPGNLRWVGGS